MMPATIPAITLSCATSIYSKTAPNFRYALSTYGLLMMTAAHESDRWQARRQYTFAATEKSLGQWNYRGAFGLHQIEKGSVESSLARLHRDAPLLERCAYWLQMHGCDAASWLMAKSGDHDNTEELSRAILNAMREPEGDPVSVLFARLHYMRVPAAIPATPERWASYAKDHYNTYLGKATPGDYFRSWNALPPEVRQWRAG